MTQFIAGGTKFFGILGCPIHHTLSPVMHNAAFAALGLPYCYLPFEVHASNLTGAVKAIVPLGILGVNITIPHKETVIPYLDKLDPSAARVGAVNTIECGQGGSKGHLIGHNTDGQGFLNALTEMEIDPSSKRVILLGAGGAASGVAFTLAVCGISELLLMVRTQGRGDALAKRLHAMFPKLRVSVIPSDLSKGLGISLEGTLRKHAPPTLLINATPVGMKPDDPTPFPLQYLNPDWVVADLIYRPRETLLLRSAKGVGARVVPGIGMLLHQGALAFEIWLKEKAPLDVMRRALD